MSAFLSAARLDGCYAGVTSRYYKRRNQRFACIAIAISVMENVSLNVSEQRDIIELAGRGDRGSPEAGMPRPAPSA